MKAIIRYIAVLFCVYQFSITAAARPVVSVLTCSPGEQVYSLFGHTALRYRNDSRGVDLVFNYGVFDFDAPNFVWRFVLGETDYILAVERFENFRMQYDIRGSGVTEQILNIDSLCAEKLFNALLYNSLEQNRVYRYNYFFNNCTTKARDIVFANLGDSVRYVSPSSMHAMTFRQIVHNFTEGYPWYTFGIDLLLGAASDEISGHHAQFAPFVLLHDLSSAYTVPGNRPLVTNQGDILLSQERVHARNNLTPFNVSLLLLLFTFVIMLCERRSKKSYWGWDILLMFLQGVAGCVIMFMILFSQHPTVDENYLVILLNPLPLIMLPILIYSLVKHRTPVVMYLQVAMVLLFLLSAPIVGQSYPAPIYICALALLVRSWFHLNKNKICALD